MGLEHGIGSRLLLGCLKLYFSNLSILIISGIGQKIIVIVIYTEISGSSWFAHKDDTITWISFKQADLSHKFYSIEPTEASHRSSCSEFLPSLDPYQLSKIWELDAVRWWGRNGKENNKLCFCRKCFNNYHKMRCTQSRRQGLLTQAKSIITLTFC